MSPRGPGGAPVCRAVPALIPAPVSDWFWHGRQVPASRLVRAPRRHGRQGPEKRQERPPLPAPAVRGGPEDCRGQGRQAAIRRVVPLQHRPGWQGRSPPRRGRRPSVRLTASWQAGAGCAADPAARPGTPGSGRRRVAARRVPPGRPDPQARDAQVPGAQSAGVRVPVSQRPDVLFPGVLFPGAQVPLVMTCFPPKKWARLPACTLTR